MSIYEALKQKAERAEIANLAHGLAKLLEKAPVSAIDDSPSAEWLDTVDRISRALMSKLGGIGGFKEAFSLLSTLDDHSSEAVNLLAARGFRDKSSESIVWLDLLKFATRAVTYVDEAEGREIRLREQQHAATELSQHLRMTLDHERHAHANELAALRDEIQQLRTTGRRWKQVKVEA